MIQERLKPISPTELSPRIIEQTEGDPVLERLRLGRERVAKGWCQGAFSDGERVCAVGAIIYGGPSGQDTVVGEAWQVLDGAAFAIGARGVMTHNDTPGRTQEEVVALFDKAIALRLETK